MTYAGGKGGSGVYQKIISLMPPHQTYVEPFLGSGAILLTKKPARWSFGNELDFDVYWKWRNEKTGKDIINFFLSNENAFDYLKRFLPESQLKSQNPKDSLIYLDPPYLKSVRRSHRQIYRCELMEDEEHTKLLELLLKLPQNVMISGYDSDLYNDLLSTWRKVSFTGISRAGATIETVWLNFPEPMELHDYSFLGENYRTRLDIKRKKERWINKLKKMNPQERYAFLAAFEELRTSYDGENAAARVQR